VRASSARVLGVSDFTIRGDLVGSIDHDPARVIGKDGTSYPARRATRRKYDGINRIGPEAPRPLLRLDPQSVIGGAPLWTPAQPPRCGYQPHGQPSPDVHRTVHVSHRVKLAETRHGRRLTHPSH
jgi:hypothetical protein